MSEEISEPVPPKPIAWTVQGTGTGLDGRTFENGIPVNDPDLGLIVDFGTQYIFGEPQDLKIRVNGKPALGALVSAYRTQEDAHRTFHAVRQHVKARHDQALLEAMRAEAERLRGLVPVGHHLVEVKEVGLEPDGTPRYSYTVNGVRLTPQTPGLVHHGTPTAVRPGESVPFAYQPVYSLSADDFGRHVDEVSDEIMNTLTRHENRKATRARAFKLSRETGEPVMLRTWIDDCDGSAPDCGQDVLVEYALPTGLTRVERSHGGLSGAIPDLIT